MAEALFKIATKERRDFSCASAGVAAWDGDEASKNTAEIVAKRGGSMADFQSRLVSDDMMERATHVFCMTEGHLHALIDAFPEHEPKCYLMCEFVEIDGKVGRDVPDPIGQGAKAYESVAQVFDKAIPSLIAFIDQTSETR